MEFSVWEDIPPLTPCWVLVSLLTQPRALFPLDVADLGGSDTLCSSPSGNQSLTSPALCHGTALGAAIPASSSSSVSWFHIKKRLCGPSLQTPRGVTPGLRAEVAADPMKSSLGLQPAPCLIPGWNPILPTAAAPPGPLSLRACSVVSLLISCLLISRSHCASCRCYCSPAG